MSWAQRRGPSRPIPANNPPVQMFNPNQHSNTEWQASGGQVWHPQQQQQQQPHQAPRQEIVNQGQPYWPQHQQPQSYPTSQTPNSNTGAQFRQFQPQEQPSSFFQNKSGASFNIQQPEQQAYGNPQFGHYGQNNMLSTAQQPSAEQDTWGNWGWGEDDNSNAPPPIPQQPLSSTNQTIGDSFANDQSWDWSVMDPQQQQQKQQHSEENNINNLFPTIGDLRGGKPDNSTARKKLETPQWSTESQPSLESSDDVLQTSESDKSHMVSRSSTISHSPLSEAHQTENKEILKQETGEGRGLRVNATPPLPISINNVPPLVPPPLGGSDDARNPYKRTAGLSHKFKPAPLGGTQIPTATGFSSQSVNLETVPDNSEHPDYPSVLASGSKASGGQQWPQTENNEAPINDRNQYLETGQLSDLKLTEGNEVVDLSNDTLPPPGLQRLIPGQLEQNEISQPSLRGFSRMVLGQNEISGNVTSDVPSRFDLGGGPPEGLHRMVPGESSSPETSLRPPNIEENDSEMELNQLVQVHGAQPPRSATIGADTPPIQTQPPTLQSSSATNAGSNRKETIGGDLALSGGDGVEITLNTPVNGKNNKLKEKPEEHDGREAVEGQTDEAVDSNLISAVRNLTVGENLTDGHTSNNSLPEQSPRRHSRQETSDSDSERKNSRSHRDRRSAEKSKSKEKERDKYKERDVERERYRERNSDRYSPDVYADKRDGRTRRYRDRQYEEDTDYYSDRDKDRRARDSREKEYDRKYSSLRKEKDKRRKDRDPRDPRTTGRRNDYYYARRYGDDYATENRSSRPSSRSDSMHESYRERRHDPETRDRRQRDRERDRERDRYRGREHREAYNPYQSFAYDPYNPYYQQYQYYENLRRTNPQAYAEWYRKYYQHATNSAAPSFAGEDRASVHSGRSSGNEELTKDRYTRQSFYSQSNYYGQAHSISSHYGLDSSSIGYNRTLDQTDTSLIYEEQPSISQRLTPTKWATPHVKASITSGKLIRVLPNDPIDGQNATVELCSLQTFLEHDSNYLELHSFPGPLIKGVTHKKQIIEYCDNKIKGVSSNKDIVDVESYVLMWELLILLVRQNGMVVGTDIAELLLSNKSVPQRPSSVMSTNSSNLGERIEAVDVPQVSDNGSLQSILKEEEVTKKFREFLLYGSCQEALEWAMKNGLWGHALFLASKLDKRTYANVMMRFANGLTMNDPLQTLYQLLSGKMPAVVTCAADEKWGDWRPHLAMILSNSTQRPELNCKAITQLGDTLLNRGSLYAAQFCYLMAQVGFGRHGDLTAHLVLLGSDHRRPFQQFATNEAIHMTEIYEYACSLNDQNFHIGEFQFYKYLLATRLADYGLLQRSLQYLELLAGRIIYNPSEVSPSLVDGVCALADKLKFYDPIADEMEDESSFGSSLATSRADNSWLKDVRAIQSDFRSGKLASGQYDHSDLKSGDNVGAAYNAPSQDVWQQEQQQYDQRQQQRFEVQYQDTALWSTELSQQQQQQTLAPNLQSGQPQEPLQSNSLNQYQDHHQQQNYWTGQQQPQQQPWNDGQYGQTEAHAQEHSLLPQENSSGYFDSSKTQTEKSEKPSTEESPREQQPQISLPNQAKAKSAYFDDDNGQNQSQGAGTKSDNVVKQQSPKQESQSTGWFGGIFSKLSMRPKNQMKLPEDKNPKIVWDEAKKKWVNVDEDPNDPANEFKPPPKMADLTKDRGGHAPTPFVTGRNAFEHAHFTSGSDSSSSVVGGALGGFGTNVADSAQSFYAGPASLPAVPVPKEETVPSKPSHQSNMFKMQKNRNVKNAYVDVFKQNGVKANTENVPAPEQMPMLPASAQNLNFFVPQPVANADAPIDFLTPGGALATIGEPQKK